MGQMVLEGSAGVFPLQGDGPWLLGRSPESDICFLDDMSCSRRQAMIRFDQPSQCFLIENISSNTQTFVNGTPIELSTSLKVGDIVSFGQNQLSVAKSTSHSAAAPKTQIFRRGESPALPLTQELNPQSMPQAITLQESAVIGRDAELAQVVIDHPTVSRRHALLVPDGQAHRLEDLKSTNGTYVNGTRINKVSFLRPGDRIDIGPFAYVYDGHALSAIEQASDTCLSARQLTSDVISRQDGRSLRILDNVSLDIKKGEFVSIIGPSGSGKTTLMNILSARTKPTHGHVQFNGFDLHAHFELLKHDMSLVPQFNVLHEQLTLRQALDYTAKLRLPSDLSATARAVAVEHAAVNVELGEKLDTPIVSLSGGQKKRASLASEILCSPGVLFLDEVTSGLDEDTDEEIMGLLRKLADGGMTILCVTHTLANIEEFCDKIIVMATSGVMAFYGSPQGTLDFFKVDRLGRVFKELRLQNPHFWNECYERSEHYTSLSVTHEAHDHKPSSATHYTGRENHKFDDRLNDLRQALILKVRNLDILNTKIVQTGVRQFGILTARNCHLLVSDKRIWAMAGIQSVMIGILLGYAFADFGVGQVAVASQTALLMLLGLAAIWLGCNSAAQDIVGEYDIFKRESDVNLLTLPFVLSKFCVTSLFTIAQLTIVFVLTAIFSGGIPGQNITQLFLYCVTALSGVALGLVISSLANTRDQATTVVPMALIPQLVFAGVLIPTIPAFAKLLSKVFVSGYWITEATKYEFIAHDGPIMIRDMNTGAMVEMVASSSVLGVVMIIFHSLLFLAVAYSCTIYRKRRMREI